MDPYSELCPICKEPIPHAGGCFGAKTIEIKKTGTQPAAAENHAAAAAVEKKNIVSGDGSENTSSGNEK